MSMTHTQERSVPTLDELPDLVTPEEGRAVLRLSKNTMYKLLRTGAIPSERLADKSESARLC